MNSEIKKEIVYKCYYEEDFQKFTNFWKETLGCSFENLNEDSYFIVIDKNIISKMLCQKKIPVDCRCFALLYSQLDKILEYEKGTILMHNNNKGMEICIPQNCFYLKLSKKLDENVGNLEIRSVLDDKQGQWIVKPNSSEDSYIGITNDKIIETSLKEWYQIYHSTVVKKLDELDQYRDRNNDIDNIAKSAMYGILSINLQKYGYEYSLVKFEMICEEGGISWHQVIDKYIPKQENKLSQKSSELNNQNTISAS